MNFFCSAVVSCLRFLRPEIKETKFISVKKTKKKLVSVSARKLLVQTMSYHLATLAFCVNFPVMFIDLHKKTCKQNDPACTRKDLSQQQYWHVGMYVCMYVT